MRLDYKWDNQKQKVFKFCFGHKKERPTIEAMFIENKIKQNSILFCCINDVLEIEKDNILL